MTTFGDQVRDALAAIPHETGCPFGCPLSGMHPDYVGHLCTCNREQRIIRKALAAMRAVYPFTGAWSEAAKKRVLKALRGGVGTR